MQVTLRYFEGCPNWRLAARRLATLTDEFGFNVTYQLIDTPEAAEQCDFRGSPTILVDGADVFASGGDRVGLSCRVYQTPDGPAGVPSVDQLWEALGR